MENEPTPERADGTEPDDARSSAKLLRELDQLRTELAPDLEVLRHLGSGSASEVYLARERALSRLVAVKVLSKELAANQIALGRFEREARAAASLNHPNAVPVFRFGYLSTGVPFLAMYHVDGGTLEERLAREGRLPIPEARRILSQVASALAAAHQHGFVHRDVRPANILCERSAGRVLVSDFGLAGLLPQGQPTEPGLTQIGEILGMPRYQSPEQLRGEEATEACDVYSLGILGYEILTGEGPFPVSSDRDLLIAHLQSPPRSLRSLRPDVDPEMAGLLEKCLAKEPGIRPTAAFLARSLGGTGDPSVTGPPLHGGEPDLLTTLLQRRLPQVVLVTGAVGYALLSFVEQLADRGVLPEIAYRHALNTFAFGLAISAVIAWFHGAKGRQQVSPPEVLFLVVLFLAWFAVELSLFL